MVIIKYEYIYKYETELNCSSKTPKNSLMSYRMRFDDTYIM